MSTRGNIAAEQIRAADRQGDGPYIQMAKWTGSPLSGPVSGNVPIYDSNGNLIDSGGPPAGSGSGGFTFTPPAVGDYTWVNQGNATANNTYGPLDMQNLNGAGGFSLSCLVKTIPSAPYRFSCLIGLVGDSSSRGGICLRESSSGKLVVYEIYTSGNDWQLNADNMTNPTTSSAAVFGPSGHLGAPNLYGVWMAIYDDNTSRHFQVGIGQPGYVYWQEAAAKVSRTSFCTPDQIGFAMQPDVAGKAAFMRVYHETTSL